MEQFEIDRNINETRKFLPHSIFEGTTPESKKRFEESANIFSGYDTIINDVLDKLALISNKLKQDKTHQAWLEKITRQEGQELLVDLMLEIANIKQGYIAPDIHDRVWELCLCKVFEHEFAGWINGMVGGTASNHGIKDEMVLDYDWYLDEIRKSRKEITELSDDLFEVTETKQNNEYLDSDFTSNIDSFTDYLFDIERECDRSKEGLWLPEVDDKKRTDFAIMSALKVAKENVRVIKDLIKALEAVGDSINKFDSVYG